MTPLGQTIVQLAALGPVANTDTNLLIYQLLQKGRVLAQDAVRDCYGWLMERVITRNYSRR